MFASVSSGSGARRVEIKPDTKLESLEIPFLDTCLVEIFNLLPPDFKLSSTLIPKTPAELAEQSGYDLHDCIRRLREIKYLSYGGFWDGPITQAKAAGDKILIKGRGKCSSAERALGISISELLEWQPLTDWLGAGASRTPEQVLIVSDKASLAFSACMYLRQEGVSGARWWCPDSVY